jgi:diaminopimelate decarboxylase
MSAFTYRNGVLHAEEVDLETLARAVGTPCFVYAQGALEENYRTLAQALSQALPQNDPLPCYALKANSNLAVIRTFAALGAGADVVSGGELTRALRAGVPPSKIVFSGVGKTPDEMRLALETGIHQINVESAPELELLSAVAASMGKRARIAIRVNPDVNAYTHAKITTGKKENKFGVNISAAPALFAQAAALPGIDVRGIAVHIGSQITTLDPWRAAFARVRELAESLRASGIGIDTLDLGGGIGIRYRDETPPSAADYAAMVAEVFRGFDARLVFEPGRILVGDAGLLLTRVLFVKQGEAKRFLILDAAMNDLIRPTLYEAYHEIVPVKQPAAGAPVTPADIVGPVCETGDTFALDRPMPPIAAGDAVAILTSGAYGAVMGSTYNTRPLAAEVLVNGNAFAVVRRAWSVNEMLALEAAPDWRHNDRLGEDVSLSAGRRSTA